MEVQESKDRAGFTLIEALLASGILALALISVLALASKGFRYIGDMRRYARSTQVLQQKMEDIRLTNIWSAVWSLNGQAFSDSTVLGDSYGGIITVCPNPPYPTDFVAQVTVTVTWTNSASCIITNRLTSVICLNGLDKYIL
jgi:Tfp pilus assembly protein PilV